MAASSYEDISRAPWRKSSYSGNGNNCVEIADWRKKIDQLDEQIVLLLSERAAAAVAIGKLKQKTASAIYEPQRDRKSVV